MNSAELHTAIMNLPCDPGERMEFEWDLAYATGHRDARHAAAELVLAALAAEREAMWGVLWQRDWAMQALKRCDSLFLEIYSNAQKMPWHDIEQLGKAGLDVTAAALAQPPAEKTADDEAGASREPTATHSAESSASTSKDLKSSNAGITNGPGAISSGALMRSEGDAGSADASQRSEPPQSEPAERVAGMDLPTGPGVWMREETEYDQRYEILVRNTGWSGWVGNKAASGTQVPKGGWQPSRQVELEAEVERQTARAERNAGEARRLYAEVLETRGRATEANATIARLTAELEQLRSWASRAVHGPESAWNAWLNERDRLLAERQQENPDD